MRRREFITLLGGAVAWPLAARAQQGERVRRVGVLSNFAESDLEAQSMVEAFHQTLQELGWVEGHNLLDPLAQQFLHAPTSLRLAAKRSAPRSARARRRERQHRGVSAPPGHRDARERFSGPGSTRTALNPK